MATKQDTKDQTNSKRRYDVTVCLRVTGDEYSFLSQKARQMGCNISTMFRYLAFENSSVTARKKSGYEEKKNIESAVKKVRDSFKSIASDYHDFVQNYKENAGRAMENPASQVVLEQSVRAAKSLVNLTLEAQREVNEFLHEFGQTETHTAVRESLNGLPDVPEAGKEKPSVTNKHIYMERVSVIGRLDSDATAYVASDGTEKMRAKVLVERTRGKKTKKVFYNVYAVKNKSFESLKKGRTVFFEGDFDENDEGEKKVFADIIKLVEG